MILVILAKNFNFASKVIVGTFNKLEFAHLPMPIQVLSLNL